MSGKWYSNVRRNIYDFKIEEWLGSSVANKEAQPEIACASSEFRPFGRWFEHFFGDIDINVVCFTR